MKMLGIDFGTKNVGLAISDEAGIAAYPRQVIRNDQKLIEVITKLVQDEDIGTIVLGESIDQSGQENAIMPHVRKFVSRLEKQVDVPIVMQSEQYSSMAASSLDHHMRNQSGRRMKKPADSIDAQAAAIILQRYLDRQK